MALDIPRLLRARQRELLGRREKTMEILQQSLDAAERQRTALDEIDVLLLELERTLQLINEHQFDLDAKEQS